MEKAIAFMSLTDQHPKSMKPQMLRMTVSCRFVLSIHLDSSPEERKMGGGYEFQKDDAALKSR